MTEVPEYLFERSRQRRVALGLLEDDGSGGAAASEPGDGAGQASSGPSSADVIAAAKADAANAADSSCLQLTTLIPSSAIAAITSIIGPATIPKTVSIPSFFNC